MSEFETKTREALLSRDKKHAEFGADIGFSAAKVRIARLCLSEIERSDDLVEHAAIIRVLEAIRDLEPGDEMKKAIDDMLKVS